MKTTVLLSGGVDSSVLLALAAEENGRENVTALSFFYGQKHCNELDAAEKIAGFYNVAHFVLDLSQIFKGCSCPLLAESEGEIPHESYAEQLKKTAGAPVSTYVPFRNGLFLSAAASFALGKGSSVLMYGAHSDDAAGNAYPDCSIAFVKAMDAAVKEGSGGMLNVEAPFAALNKAAVVARGKRLGVPFELTRSCYEGGDEPCRVCATCRDRRAAFIANGIDLW